MVHWKDIGKKLVKMEASMKLVIVESPYAGQVEENVSYARSCIRDSLSKGEAPIASHLLYTQPGILRDYVPDERKWGIDAGLAWRQVAQLQVFYTDRGWSNGMLAAFKQCLNEKREYELRSLSGEIQHPILTEKMAQLTKA